MTSPARTRSLALAAALAVAGLALSSCGSSGSDSTSTPSNAVTGTREHIPVTPANAKGCRTATKLAAETEEPKIIVPKPVSSAPYVTDSIPGCGAVVKNGQELVVQYALKSSKTGNLVDSSWASGQPYPFQLGAGAVIPGWDRGLPGMRVGGRRTLVLPPKDAYGAAGQPPAIAKNDTLVFVIDVLSAN